MVLVATGKSTPGGPVGAPSPSKVVTSEENHFWSLPSSQPNLFKIKRDLGTYKCLRTNNHLAFSYLMSCDKENFRGTSKKNDLTDETIFVEKARLSVPPCTSELEIETSEGFHLSSLISKV